MNKCYRVWYKSGSVVLVDAETEQDAKKQAEAISKRGDKSRVSKIKQIGS